MFDEQLLSRAEVLFQQKRFKEAENDYGKVLAMDPSNAYAHSMMSLCCMNLEKFADAEKHAATAIGLDPAAPFMYYSASIIYYNQNKMNESKKFIHQALALNPYDANFYGILANIHLRAKEWQKALEHANEGLAIESDNIDCLNARAKAFIKLDKKEEAYETIKEALYFDPENSHTHSNVGWGLIEKGDYKKALFHFKEALAIDPNNGYAKAGLVEALKARYWFYRMFLRYAFWIGNMKGNAQWGIMIGLYICFQAVKAVGENYPGLQVITMPLIIAYVLFAITTWIIGPLSNLFLRLNVYGKYALSKTEIRCSNVIGISLLTAIVAGIFYLVTGYEYLMVLGVVAFAMMIPFSGMYSAIGRNKGNKALVIFTLALGAVGLVSVIVSYIGSAAMGSLFGVFLIGVLVYQWVANAIFIKS